MKILRFTASWCAPCKTLAQNLEEANLDIPIEVVDIDIQSDVAIEYGVRGVPTLILMDGNIEVKRTVGNRTVQEIKNWATT